MCSKLSHSYTADPRSSDRASQRLKTWSIALAAIIGAVGVNTTPALASLQKDSVLEISSRGIGNVPKRKVTIRLEEDNALVFRSGQVGKFMPVDEAGNQLTFGSDQDKLISVLPSSTDSFTGAFADLKTRIQDLPLNSSGKYEGRIPGFIQNVWLRTPGGGRTAVNVNLDQLTFDPLTGGGEITGDIEEEDGTLTPITGRFQIADSENRCACNYTLQIRVLELPPPSIIPPERTPVATGIAGGGLGAAGGVVLSALPIMLALGGGNQATAATPVPTPALVPGMIAMALKIRQRRQKHKSQ